MKMCPPVRLCIENDFFVMGCPPVRLCIENDFSASAEKIEMFFQILSD